MSPKFNRPIPPRVPDAVTAQGGEGFARDPKDELFLLGVANMVGEDTFYESADVRDKRFSDLVHRVTQADPEWTRQFIGWLRSEGNMRSAPIVAAVEYIRAGGEGGRQVVTSVLQRPDEPAEMIGYWLSRYGRAIPMPVKRGIADALPRLYNERNTLRYDGAGQAIRFGDVIELVHPKPVAPWQGALYRHLIDRRHNRPDPAPPILATLVTDAELMRIPQEGRRAQLGAAIAAGWSWERVGGWLGAWDAAAWEAVIPNMGLMALTRNLRNFDKAGISDAAALEVTRRFMDRDEVVRSRQFPLRFLTAWKAVASMRWGMALEAALNHSLANVPRLAGHTLILVDVSGSMQDHATSRRTDRFADGTVTPLRWEVAATFAAALGQRSDEHDIVLFATGPKAIARTSPAESVLRFVEQCGHHIGGGTDIFGSLIQSYRGHDRVVILTDEQTGAGRYAEAAQSIRCPVYVFNIAGYRVGSAPNERNWHTFGGLTDACFKLLPLLEARQRNRWPWETDYEAAPQPSSTWTIPDEG